MFSVLSIHIHQQLQTSDTGTRHGEGSAGTIAVHCVFILYMVMDITGHPLIEVCSMGEMTNNFI